MNKATTDTRELSLADDSGMGLQMFVIFTAACLLVTGAVAMLALIDTWWVLGLAFGIHVVIAAAVGVVVFNALSGGGLTARGQSQPADENDQVEVPAKSRVRAQRAHPAAA